MDFRKNNCPSKLKSRVLHFEDRTDKLTCRRLESSF
nr:MAG TPA: hypothetical protein [Caudoviricetes sp.]